MANPRVYAGFYKRYVGKIVYVITTAKDTDIGEETVIFFIYDYFTAIFYLTCSTTSFCGTVRYRGKTVKKYRRQPQMPIDDGFIELLNHKGFRGPVRKGYSDSYEIGERFFQTASNYLSYAIDLCSHYKKDLRRIMFSHKTAFHAVFKNLYFVLFLTGYLFDKRYFEISEIIGIHQ